MLGLPLYYKTKYTKLDRVGIRWIYFDIRFFGILIYREKVRV